MALTTGQNGRVDSPALRQPVRVKFTRACGEPGARYEDCFDAGDVVEMTLGQAQYFIGLNQARLTDEPAKRAKRSKTKEAAELRERIAAEAAARNVGSDVLLSTIAELKAEIAELKAAKK